MNYLWRVCVLSLFFLVGCTSKTEFTNALPKEASAVASVDLPSLIEKSGLKGAEGEKVTGKLLLMIQSGLTGEAAKLAEKMVKNPQKLGLAFNEKAYFFATPNATALGMLAKVDSESKLEEAFAILQKEQLATPLKEESGCRWTQIGEAVCAFNESSFLLVQDVHGDASSIKGSVFRWMRQDAEDSFSSLPAFTSMKEEQGDITSYINLSIVPHELISIVRMGLPGQVGVEDIAYLFSLRFDQGKVALRTRSLSQHSLMNQIFRRLNESTSPIAGKFLTYFPANVDLWLGAHIQGKELYDLMAGHPLLRRMLENPKLPVDVKRILSAMKGDVAIGYTSLQKGSFLAYADVSSADFLQTFEELRPLCEMSGGQLSLETLGKDQYLLHTYQGRYWFGVRNGLCYASNSATLAEEAGRSYGVSLLQKPWTNDAIQQRFLLVNQNLEFKNAVRSMNMVPSLLQVPGATIFLATLTHSEAFTVSVPEWNCSEFTFYLRNQQKNLLQIFLGLWK